MSAAQDPWQRDAAAVALMLARREVAAIASAIRGHDHDRMKWLVHAATLSEHPGLHEALEACHRNYSDDCAAMCKAALDGLQRLRDSI